MYKDHLDQIREHLRSGALREAERSARSLISGPSADRPEGLILLAESLRRLGSIEEAIAVRSRITSATDPSLEADIRLFDTRILLESGRERECIERFGALSPGPAPSITDIKVQDAVAICHARIGQTAEARRTLEWVISEAARVGWEEGTADALMRLGILDQMEGHWSRGVAYLLKAREAYRRLGNTSQYIAATLALALQRLDRGHFSYAEDTLREVIHLTEKEGNVRSECIARVARSTIRVRLGRLDEARRELALALRLSRRQASPGYLASALASAAELHLAERRLVRATAVLRQGFRVTRSGHIAVRYLPSMLRLQAELELALGHPELALELTRQAEEQSDRLKDRYEQAAAQRIQGQALAASGRTREAARILDGALATLEELGETFERDRVLDLLRRLCPTHDGRSREPSFQDQDMPAPSGGTGGTVGPEEVHRVLCEYGIVGRSRTLIDVFREAVQLARLDLPILIEGETGTGKELLARALHGLSCREDGPFVTFNCASCPPDLMDSELFGHSRGAFTGAAGVRLGLVRSAQGGTLFLDEIGEMRLEAQGRLLRFLDSGEIRPLGSDRTLRVMVRILAATNVDLEAQVRRNQFRRDLYFRLAGIRLVLPPLRKRPEDIPLLVAHYVQVARDRFQPGFAGFSDTAMRTFEAYPWPGNIRQLKSEIFRCAALARDGVSIDRWAPPGGELELDTQGARGVGKAPVPKDPLELARLLAQCDGRVARLAMMLGMSRSHVYRLLTAAGISPKPVRPQD